MIDLWQFQSTEMEEYASSPERKNDKLKRKSSFHKLTKKLSFSSLKDIRTSPRRSPSEGSWQILGEPNYYDPKKDRWVDNIIATILGYINYTFAELI